MFVVTAALGELYAASFPSLEMPSKHVRLVYCFIGFVLAMALRAAAQCNASCERVSVPISYGFGELKENLDCKSKFSIACRNTGVK